MACETEQDMFERYQAGWEAAKEAFDKAVDDSLTAMNDANAADAAYYKCAADHPILDLVGYCADAEAAKAAADAREASANAARDKAYDAAKEAEHWFSVALDAYCDCLLTHPDAS
jgi:hypothetical protein